MKILILNGSPSNHGNTMAMITTFQNEARKLGHEVFSVPITQKNIGGCLACEYCHTGEHTTCIQQDDMQEICPLLKESDMLILASPIYYHNISGQLKCCVDRFYALPPWENLKKIAMFLSSGSDQIYDGAVFSYKGDFLDYLGLEDMGVYTMAEESEENQKTLCDIADLAHQLEVKRSVSI